MVIEGDSVRIEGILSEEWLVNKGIEVVEWGVDEGFRGWRMRRWEEKVGKVDEIGKMGEGFRVVRWVGS